MLKERARLFALALLALELLVWTGAFFGAGWLRAVAPRFVPWLAPLPEHPLGVWFLACALGLWVVGSALVGLRRSFRARPIWEALAPLLRAGAIVFFGLLTLLFFGRIADASRLVVVLFAALGLGGLVALHVAVRAVLHNARRLGLNFRTLVVVGDGPLADEIAIMVRSQGAWGLRFLGFVTVDGSRRGGRVLGHVRDIASVVDGHPVDEVIFAVEDYRPGDLEDAFSACEETGVNTRVVLNFFPHKFSRPALSDLDGLPLLSFHPTSNDQLALGLKRVFDVAVALTALVVGSPVFLLAAAAVKLDSRGPVLFRQSRVGLNGREFPMLKFRSMVADAEQRRAGLEAHNEMSGGPAFKIRNDPRVTRVGRWLRKTSLDELPQFWNVLRGDMSVVGPRPPLATEVARYERWQRRRLSVKPGITCIWQISGRNQVDFEGWMRMDMQYIENWSLWLDMKIFVRTIPAVLFGRGAS
jgi:exopolysaccharide biosynthesis polyprenyl glycosylphosphotransferase